MIRIKDLQKSYGEKPVLSHFSHDLPDNGIGLPDRRVRPGQNDPSANPSRIGNRGRRQRYRIGPAVKLRLFFKRTVCCLGLQPSRIFAWRSQPGQNDQWESC